jgi:ribosomal protein S18 acetylase RimI-like enzyme
VTPLDDPVWQALTTEHAGLARAHGAARRYAPDVAGFVAAHDFGDLRALVEPGQRVATVTTAAVALPTGWTLMGERWIEQMVYDGDDVPAAADELVELGDGDAPEMLALATKTQPGPFFARTHTMGRYLGIKRDGRLVAMAGERLALQDATEISAVCTDPAFTGRGYGRALLEATTARILAAGRQPFLHVKNENGAKRLYERLGFRVRREMRLTVFSAAA